MMCKNVKGSAQQTTNGGLASASKQEVPKFNWRKCHTSGCRGVVYIREGGRGDRGAFTRIFLYGLGTLR